MRILGMGSRDVRPSDRPVVEMGLREVVGDAPGQHTLVHGDAPGTDRLLGRIATAWGWNVETYPADWSAPCNQMCRPDCRKIRDDGTEYCSAAGHHRNQRMVDLGADRAFAVYKRGAQNRGTSDCVRRARAAGIDVERVAV